MPFDFGKHRQDSLDAYRAKLATYEQFAEAVRSVLRVSIPGHCPIHSIEARAKGVDEFADKACKKNDAEQPKYPSPMDQITDLAGIRVITFFPRNLDDVGLVIDGEFDVVERKDKGEELVAVGRFGYQSIHYLVRLKTSRTALPEYRRFDGLVAEIQVRTILQHAWAEMEHDIQYKSVAAIPTLIRRRFGSLAGMLEIADREFQAIQDADAELRKEVGRPLEDELTVAPELRVEVAPPEQQLDELNEASPPQLRQYIPGSARALLASGYYAEAIRAYDAAIELHPDGHTNYLGRARARFLSGDTAGALEDVATAAALDTDDPQVARLRAQIQEGAVSSPEEKALAQAEAYRGNAYIAAGEPEEAMPHYRAAEARGWGPVFSQFNKAIASCLAGDRTEMREHLGSLHLRHGSVYGITKTAIEAVADAILNEDLVEQLGLLQAEVDALGTFSFARSHLRYLEEGLGKRDAEAAQRAAPIFAILRGRDAVQRA